MSKFFEVKIRVLEQNPKTGRNKFRSETHLIPASTKAEAWDKLPEYTFDVVKVTLSKIRVVSRIRGENAYLVKITGANKTLFYLTHAPDIETVCRIVTQSSPVDCEIISVVKSNLITESWL